MKKFLATILSVCMLVPLASCGGAAAPAASTAPAASAPAPATSLNPPAMQSAAPAASAAPEASEAPEASGAPAESAAPDTAAAPAKDTIVVGTASEPSKWVTLVDDYSPSSLDDIFLHNVYNTLVKFGPDGTIQPHLAESWEVAEDGMTYTFHLREGVKFHNGYDCTASDAAFSINSAAATRNGKLQIINFESAEAVDDTTLVIHMTAPFAPFIAAFASRFTMILSEQYFNEVGADGYYEMPIGTGAYKFVERVTNDHITFAANEEYWDGAPAYKNVTLRFISDINAQMMALENGDIDALINAPLAQMLQLPADSPIKWMYGPASGHANLSFNSVGNPLIRNKDFRKAIQAAINKDEIVLGVWEDMVDPLDQPIVNFWTGYPGDGNFNKVAYDPEAAKAFLAASGYNNEEFSLVVTAGSKEEQAAIIIQGQLAAIGINCVVQATDNATYTAVTTDRTNQYGGNILGATVSNMDADALYGTFNYDYKRGQGWTEEEIANYVSNQEMSDLLEQARSETDAAARAELYGQIVNIITEEAFNVALYPSLGIVAYNEAIQGVTLRPLPALQYFNEWH